MCVTASYPAIEQDNIAYCNRRRAYCSTMCSVMILEFDSGVDWPGEEQWSSSLGDLGRPFCQRFRADTYLFIFQFEGRHPPFFYSANRLLINCLSIHHETCFSSMCISRVKRSKWLLLMKILGVFRSYLETATSEDYMCKSHLDAMKSNRLLGNCQGEEIKRENKRWGKFSMPVAELG